MRFAPGTDPQVMSAATQQWLGSQPSKTPAAPVTGPTIGATGIPHPRASAGQVRIDSLIHGPQPSKTPAAPVTGPTIGATGIPHPRASAGQVRIDSLIHGPQPSKTPAANAGSPISLGRPVTNAPSFAQSPSTPSFQGGLASLVARLRAARNPGQTSAFNPMVGGLGGFFSQLQSVRQQPLNTAMFSGSRTPMARGLGSLQTPSMFRPSISGPFGSSFNRGFSFYR